MSCASLASRLLLLAKHRVRFFILLLTFLITGSILNCVDAHNYTKEYMEEEALLGIVKYSVAEKEMLISVMAAGSIIGLVPVSLLYEKFRARYVMFFASFICCVASALLPLCYDTSIVLAIIIRIVQGVCFSASFSVVGIVASQWSPLSELGIFLAVLSSFTGLKAIVQMPLAGWLVPSYGWRSLHYVLAGILFICSSIWLLFYKDDPRNSCSTKKEILYIQDGKSVAHNEMKIQVPYKKALCDLRLWILWFTAFIDIFASVFWIVEGIFYFKSIHLHERLGERAPASFISYQGIAFLTSKLLTGFVSDSSTCLSDKTKIRIFSILSLGFSGGCLFAIAFSTEAITKAILSVIFQSLIGTNVGAFYRASVLMSRQYSHFVVGLLQLFKSLSILFIPLITTSFIMDNTEEEWKCLFLTIGGILLIGCLLLLAVASDQPYTWAQCEKEDNENVTVRNKNVS